MGITYTCDHCQKEVPEENMKSISNFEENAEVEFYVFCNWFCLKNFVIESDWGLK
jgi:hypothetical protein